MNTKFNTLIENVEILLKQHHGYLQSVKDEFEKKEMEFFIAKSNFDNMKEKISKLTDELECLKAL